MQTAKGFVMENGIFDLTLQNVRNKNSLAIRCYFQLTDTDVLPSLSFFAQGSLLRNIKQRL